MKEKQEPIQRYALDRERCGMVRDANGLWINWNDLQTVEIKQDAMRSALEIARRALYDHGDMRFIAQAVDTIDTALKASK